MFQRDGGRIVKAFHKGKMFKKGIRIPHKCFRINSYEVCNPYLHKQSAKYTLHKKLSFPLRICSVNVAKSQFPADLVTCTEEILNGKLHFCAVIIIIFKMDNKVVLSYVLKMTLSFV